jgi:hypothetical protein
MNTEALKRLVTILENDIGALGWDQPVKIYAILGTLEDPRFDLLLEGVDAKPQVVLQASYDDGLRMKSDVLGLAVCSEGWRMRMPSELTEEQMPQLAEMRAAGRARGLSEDETENRLSLFFAHMANEFGVSNQPDWLKVESRQVTVVMKDGTVVVGNRDRDHPLEVGHSTVPGSEVFDRSNFLAGNVPEAMFAVLHWRRPEF